MNAAAPSNPLTPERRSEFPQLCGWGVAGAAALALAARLAGLPLPGFLAGLRPGTSAGLALAGLGLALSRPRRPSDAAGALGLACILLGAGSLCAWAFAGADWTAPHSALELLLLGSTLLMSGRRWGQPEALAAWLPVPGLWVAMVVLIGHVLGQPALTGHASRGMSLFAALGFALLAAGLLVLEGDRGPVEILRRDTLGGRVIRARLPWLLGIPVVLGWLRLLGERSGALPGELGVPITVIVAITLMVAINVHAILSLDRMDADRARAEKEARESRMFLESVLDNLPDMVFIKDAGDLRFVRINRAGEELLGYSGRELTGQSDHDFFPPEQADFFIRMDREVLRSGRMSLIEDEPIETKAGRRLLRTRKVSIPGADGAPAFLLGISEDVTELRRAEQEKERLSAELKSALENIHTLEGILPICSTCKKIRDGKGYWHRVEAYLETHMAVRMSHGMCEDCMSRFHPPAPPAA